MLDQALDAAEALGQRPHPRARDAASTASVRPSTLRNETMPPKPSIWRAAISWPGWLGRARGRAPVSTLGCAARGTRPPAPRSRSARASAPPASSARAAPASSRTARAPRPASSAGTAAARPARRRSSPAKPPTSVGVPAEVLRGRVQHDVGAQLERPLQVRRSRTCCRPPAARRRRARPRRPRAMSTTFSSGLVGVSIHTSRVPASRCAARLGVASVGVESTSKRTPFGSYTFENRR